MLKILSSSFSFVKEKYCTLIRMVVKNNRRIYPKFLSAKLLGTYLWLIDFDDFQIIVVIFPIPLTINNRVHLPTNIKNAIRKISAFWGFFFLKFMQTFSSLRPFISFTLQLLVMLLQILPALNLHYPCIAKAGKVLLPVNQFKRGNK